MGERLRGEAPIFDLDIGKRERCCAGSASSSSEAVVGREERLERS